MEFFISFFAYLFATFAFCGIKTLYQKYGDKVKNYKLDIDFLKSEIKGVRETMYELDKNNHNYRKGLQLDIDNNGKCITDIWKELDKIKNPK